MKFKPNQTRTYDGEGFKQRAACLCFRNEREDEVLLVSSSRHPDQWIVPGGGMEPEEEPCGAAVREVYEEAGVKGKLGRLLGVFEHNQDRKHRTYVYVLTVTETLEAWEDSVNIDTAYSCDPRIKKFKEEEKARKESEKKAKAEAKKKEQDEKERARQAEVEAARLAREKEEEEAKQAAQQAKKEKEAQKKAIKKERQKLRTTCKNCNYFADNEADSVKMMEDVEKLCDRLELLSLQTLNELLASGGKEESRAAIEKQVQEVNAQLQREREAEVRTQQAARSSENANAGSGVSKGWNEEDLQLLIKAVNLFPAGTNARWEVIANYMNLHSGSGIKRTAKDVINKAKTLQKLDPHQKEEVNKKAFEKFKKEHSAVPPAVDNAVPSERFEGSASDTNPAPWTTEEQKLLEQALKTYPVNTPERWDKIAAAVPGRTKKDCMKRYKELVEMIKAKKAAQEQVTAKNKK
ncbi:dnaJ homolog subfamily C member 2 [Tachysurus ichikawai]